MYNLIKVYLYIGNFNAGTPNYHHCLLSFNLLSVLKGREECSIISLCMHTYWIVLILTLISTLNVPICKIKYQNMFDHFANHHLYDQLCGLPSAWSWCKYYTAVKVILMHNTVVYMYLHSYKINILICNSKIYWISKETIMHNSETFMLNA